MTTTKTTENTKKPKRKKAKTRMSLKEYIPNYREFQKEVARLEEMLGHEADPEATLDLPPGITREWAVNAWPVVKANAEIEFRPLKPGTEFPSGIYADRAELAMLQIRHSPFNDRLRTLAIRQMLGTMEMREKARAKLARAARRAEAAQA